MRSQKKIKTEDAVGTMLAHDITRIVPGEFKGVGFKKGHLIQQEDIPELLKIGKEHIYILELREDELHEDDAAIRIARSIAGENLTWSEPSEGKSTLTSDKDGILKINTEGLLQINRLENIIVATLKTAYPCQKNQPIAAARIIPLFIERDKIERVEKIAAEFQPIVGVLPYKKLRVGGVVTGSEIYKGLIKDEFETYVGKKVLDYGCELVKKIIVPDDPAAITGAVLELKALECDLILTTGGMSVDPDDVTKVGIKQAGVDVISYGSPILPGAMFLYGLLGNTTVLGLPACVFYHQTTIYDIVLPRVLSGEIITRDEIAALGHGGLCMNCEPCRFPECSFGK